MVIHSLLNYRLGGLNEARRLDGARKVWSKLASRSSGQISYGKNDTAWEEEIFETSWVWL